MRTGPLALWDPVADCRSGSVDTRDCEYCQSWGVTEAVARRGRSVSAGREGQDDLVVKVWRAVRPKRLIGSLNRDTGVSPGGPQNELNNAAPKSPGLMLVRYFMACACPNDDVRYSVV